MSNGLKGTVVVAVIAVRMMQMAVVKIIDMIAVADRHMSAARPVAVVVVGVDLMALDHARSPS